MWVGELWALGVSAHSGRTLQGLKARADLRYQGQFSAFQLYMQARAGYTGAPCCCSVVRTEGLVQALCPGKTIQDQSLQAARLHPPVGNTCIIIFLPVGAKAGRATTVRPLVDAASERVACIVGMVCRC